jgi:DNA polymerase III subunit chi
LTQVFFYHGAADRMGAICSLLGKAALQKKSVLVLAPQKSLAEQVDRSLWTHTALGFFPHCRADSPLAGETPILITEHLGQPPHYERLMNLGQTVPQDYQRFQSLIEVVGQDEDDRLAARDRVRQYKDGGCEVRYFDLNER